MLIKTDFSCFIPELSYIKKYLKYVLNWKNISENILNAIPYSNINSQNLIKNTHDIHSFNKIP
jgi:hypothetical protein